MTRYVLAALSFALLWVVGTRLYVEAEVVRAEAELADLQVSIEEAQQAVAEAKLNVEILESTGRLTALNADHLALRTVRPDQVINGASFAAGLGIALPKEKERVSNEADIIGNAISMTDPTVLLDRPSE